MDATTRQICDMLGGQDPELAAAAAKVLGALGPNDEAILDALTATLRDAPGPVRLYALDALVQSGSPKTARYLLPALAARGELRDRAIAALDKFSVRAASHLKDGILGKDKALQLAAATALAHIGGKEAWTLLLRALASGDLDLAKHICFELSHGIEGLTDHQKATFLAQVKTYLSQKRLQKKPVALGSGLILIGYLGPDKAVALLLKFASPGNDADVRHRALLALRGAADALKPADVKKLVDWLEDQDIANVVLPIVEMLRRVTLPASAAPRILALTESPHPRLRQFAVDAMAGLATPKAAGQLMDLLDSTQPAIRDHAANALRRNPAAAPLLLKRIPDETDPERLWTCCRVLVPHAETLKPAQRTAVTKTLLASLETNDGRSGPLGYLARHVDPEGLDDALLKRAQRLRTARKYAEADRILHVLVRSDHPSTEALYQAAIVGLKVSPQELVRSARNNDPCIRLLDRLLADESVDLTRKLKADKTLTLDDLFYAGFHFAEQLGPRREFGGALLRHVVKKNPRGAVGKKAKNKLRLAAFDIAPAKKKSK